MKYFTFTLILLNSIMCYSQLEIPTRIDGCYIVEHEYYTLCYNDKHEQASWVAYAISYDMAQGSAEVKDNFKVDPKVHSGSAQLIDYKDSGYDPGHLAPAAVMRASELCMSESFYLSNMSPQVPSFNRGVWKELEAWVRGKAMGVSGYDTVLYVVTGPVLTDNLKTIGPNKVSVPEYYFKVIYDPTDIHDEAGLGFLMKNEPSKLEPTSEVFLVSIDSIEAITGIDFFPLLEDERERAIEANNIRLIYVDGGVKFIEVELIEVPTAIQCEVIDRSGIQCKRNAESGKKFCSQHRK